MDGRRVRDLAAVDYDEWTDVTFWQALGQLMELSKTRLDPQRLEPDAQVITERSESDDRSSATQDGLFRIETVRIADLPDGPHPKVRDCRITLGVWWEPRSHLVCLKHRLGSVRYRFAPDEAVISQENDVALELLLRPHVPFAETSLTLTGLPRNATCVALLEGDMDAVVLGKVAEFTFQANELLRGLASSQPAKVISRHRFQVTVQLQNVRRRDRRWDVRLSVAYDREGTAFESHRGWIFRNPAFLRNAEGETISPIAMETISQRGSRYVFDYTFDIESLAGHEFVYRTAAAVIDVPIQYRLQDIPLP